MKTSTVSDETRAKLRAKIAASKRPSATVSPAKPVVPLPAAVIPRGVVQQAQEPEQKDPYHAPKTAKEYAAEIARDLPLGKVLNRSGAAVTKELSTRDLPGASKTQQKIMDLLAAKGVVQKRSRKPALVTDQYRPEGATESKSDSMTTDVVSALVNLGKNKKEAVALARAAKGETIQDRIKSALSQSLPTAA